MVNTRVTQIESPSIRSNEPLRLLVEEELVLEQFSGKVRPISLKILDDCVPCSNALGGVIRYQQPFRQRLLWDIGRKLAPLNSFLNLSKESLALLLSGNEGSISELRRSRNIISHTSILTVNLICKVKPLLEQLV